MFLASDAGKARAVAAAAAQDLNDELTIILTAVTNVAAGLESGDPRWHLLMEAIQAAERCGHKTRGLLNYAARSGAKPQPAQMEILIDG